MPKKPTSVARTQFPPSGSRKNAIRPSSKDAQPPARYLHFDKSREVDSLLDQAERARSCLVAGSASLRKALETRLRGGLLVSPAPRLFARAQYWGDLTSTQRHRHVLLGLGRLHPSWVACGISAAVAHELQVPYRLLDGKTHVTGCDKHAKTWGEIRVHKASREIEPVMVGGIPVTSVPQTALDCARLVDARGGLAIADSALRACGMAREELVDYVEAHGRGLRGITLAREVASMADARSANGGESIARRVMHELGYVLPELQVCFADPMDPQRRYYADFVWPHAEGGLVIGELDGVEKYMAPRDDRPGRAARRGPSGATARVAPHHHAGRHRAVLVCGGARPRQVRPAARHVWRPSGARADRCRSGAEKAPQPRGARAGARAPRGLRA